MIYKTISKHKSAKLLYFVNQWELCCDLLICEINYHNPDETSVCPKYNIVWFL